MMQDLDRALGSTGLTPAQRPIRAATHVATALGYSDKPMLPLERIESSRDFDPGWCVRNAWLWYESVYADQVSMDWGPGALILDIRGTLWRFRMPLIFGRVQIFVDRNLKNVGGSLERGGRTASVNLLCQIEGLSEELATRLSQAECDKVLAVFRSGFPAVKRLSELKGDGLFQIARNDYVSSIVAMLGSMWAKARWDTAQCAEKVLKGILNREGRKYPKGSKGHDIVLLGGLVAEATGVQFPHQALAAADCSTNVRYGEVPASQDEALLSHTSLLQILNSLP